MKHDTGEPLSRPHAVRGRSRALERIVLDVEHHASKDGQGMIVGKRAVRKDRRCRTLGGRRHAEKHRNNLRSFKFWARIGGRDELPVAIACQKGHIDAEVCAFTAGE